ncbi:MAG TPA: hypothetical protein VNX47_13410, partial [Nevskia sp.]|nr:hypothetical protein [Nevskia sp.]
PRGGVLLRREVGFAGLLRLLHLLAGHVLLGRSGRLGGDGGEGEQREKQAPPPPGTGAGRGRGAPTRCFGRK